MADRIAELHDAIRNCRKCGLCRTRNRAVPGEGPPQAGAMLVGEAPGAEEDRTGRPFCGRAGSYLDSILADVGLCRKDIYITSIAKCRPPENRNPEPAEISTCTSAWLAKQVELVNPGLVILCGKTAGEWHQQRQLKLAEAHGQIKKARGRSWLITYHPAAAMRFPVPARGFERDMQVAACWLSQK